MIPPTSLTTGAGPLLSTARTTSPSPAPIPEGPEPVLTLYAPLGEGPEQVDGHELARHIWALERQGHRVIHVRINSPGGSVAHGYSLFSALRHTRMHVHTWLDGLALSMAGLIFLAGRTRHVSPWGMLMLHDPTLEGPPVADDTPPPATNDVGPQGGPAVMLARVRAAIVRMYAAGSGLSGPMLSRMMAQETWLGASDCLRLGLAHDTGGEPMRPAFEREALSRLMVAGPGGRVGPQTVAGIEAHWRGLMAAQKVGPSGRPLAVGGAGQPGPTDQGAALWRLACTTLPLSGGPVA